MSKRRPEVLILILAPCLARVGVTLMIVLSCCGRNSIATAQAAARQPARGKSFYADDFSRIPAVPAMTSLGRKLFFDPRLSASGRAACATCHDPRFAYGSGSLEKRPAAVFRTSPAFPPAKSVASSTEKRAGYAAAPTQVRQAARIDAASGARGAVRAIPSLRYLQDIPAFSEHHFDEAVDESVDQGPTGGHMWDGRADSLHDQALLPLFSPTEMANAKAEDIVARVARAPYAKSFRDTFGSDVFEHPGLAFKGVLQALEVFQQSPKDFYPYSSRYDAWLRGKAQLSARELRGLRTFNDPKKGNCASCHPSQIRQGSFPQFTDFGYAALGVPRNRALAANRDPTYFDLGLCGPARRDLQQRTEYCGLFRVPTLRNVALRRRFFHNGVFRDLREVIEFYARRDTEPARFYGRDARGTVQKFDDLPDAFRANVNSEAPFGRSVGDSPALSEGDVDDLVALLATLTDGFSPEPARHADAGCLTVACGPSE
jgi:cytochrome c peroxidase